MFETPNSAEVKKSNPRFSSLEIPNHKLSGENGSSLGMYGQQTLTSACTPAQSSRQPLHARAYVVCI